MFISFRKACIAVAAMSVIGAAHATSIDPDLSPAANTAAFVSAAGSLLDGDWTFTLDNGFTTWSSVAVSLPDSYSMPMTAAWSIDGSSAAPFTGNLANLGSLAGGASHTLTLSGFGTETGTVFINATAVVPEPESYAMMLAGLGALGFMARRRQSK